jgi:hypothetical protein
VGSVGKSIHCKICFLSAMGHRAEVHLPAAEGPGVGADQEAAVERNMKAAAFLVSAMPNLQTSNVMAAGISDPGWPNEPKAHLMIAYLKETYVEATTLSRVGTRRDLENCSIKRMKTQKYFLRD